MENINFRGIPTSLFLNGPKLGIVTDPQDQSEIVGFATFTGIATVTAGAGGTMDAGIGMGASIAFKWYLDGSEVKDINIDNTSRATILGFSSATGYGTTITFNNLTTADTGKEVYYTVDLIPTAYSQPTGSDVTAGTARSTANAINDPLQSQSAIITISPILEVTSQPLNGSAAVNTPVEFSVAGRVSPGPGFVEYQWQLDGNDLSDGENQTITALGTGAGRFTITRGSEPSIVVDATQLTSYDDFVTGEIYTIVADSDIEADLFAFGADGASDARSGNAAAGRGGTAKGRFTFIADQTYKLIVGKVGTASFYPGLKHGGGGQSRDGGDLSGGGFSGLFIDEVTQANSIIIAGGGGSAAKGNYRGAGQGGFLGADGNKAPWSLISGGSQTEGGLGFYDTRDGSGTYGTLYRYMTGTALQGGYNNGGSGSNNGGNGGGGYFGGGAGRSDSNYSPGPYGGGGGSSFLHPTLLTSGEAAGGTSALDNANNSRVAGEGGFRIEIVSVTKGAKLDITGSRTENLTITSNESINGIIRCKLTAIGVQESPVFSRSVSFNVFDSKNVINIEQYEYGNATATLSTHDLASGSLLLSYDTHPGNAICLYAGEQDIEVELDMYGGTGGEAGGATGWSGGEGGYSKIRFTMERDVEYVLTGLFSAVNAPFLYRKASLIASVGGGGFAGVDGNGGLGGGIGVSGSKGGGSGGGEAPTALKPGEGNQRARFGSKFDGEALTGGLIGDDHQGRGTENGDSAPCPRGIYWRQQGKAPCDDLGDIKFRTPNGTEISNTAVISRGYKSGYNAIQTAGAGDSAQSGDGGNGYSGGFGGTNGGGGGGAYGYTDGSVTVVKTTQGGGFGRARINIKLSDGDYFIDDEGRILILAADDRDPRTLTKTTGIVNYGDNRCIDDTRWQRFLDLARDGTQDYRLTATTNNSTVKITNATEKNIYKMMTANVKTLPTSLTDWEVAFASSGEYAIAWDDDQGVYSGGADYSGILWNDGSYYTSGYAYYGGSSNTSFIPAAAYHFTSVNWWILPPGVPDF